MLPTTRCRIFLTTWTWTERNVGQRELREAGIVAEAGGVAAAVTPAAAAGDGPDVTAASDSDAAIGAASNPPNRKVCYLWGG